MSKPGKKIGRRTFLTRAGLTALGYGWLRPILNALPHSPIGKRDLRILDSMRFNYDKAIVVDFLASPGYFNYPLNPPLDKKMLQNAVRSGITSVNQTVHGNDFKDAVQNVAMWLNRIELYSDSLMQVKTVEHLLQAKRNSKLGIVLGFQNTTQFEDDLGHIETFLNLGVKVTQLTYNIRNLVGDGCLEPANRGLTQYGHAVVERMNELGMLVDLSHCGQKTTAEAIEVSPVPVSFTHSGCNAVARHPRSKDDAELKALSKKGGVIGIYLMPFLTPGRAPTRRDVLDHIEHAVNVCGEDHVGIGSDLSTTPIDGSDEYWSRHREFVAKRIKQGISAPNEDPNILFTVEELNSHRRMELIADGLSSRGYPDARIEKIIGGNWLRLFQEIWRTNKEKLDK